MPTASTLARTRNALLVSTGLAVICVASFEPPHSWRLTERGTPLLTDSGPIQAFWHSMILAIPVGEIPQRADLIVATLVVLSAVAAAWASYQLYRGPGRWLSSVATAPIVTLALLAWANSAGVQPALRVLPATLAAILAVTACIRPLVHLGVVTPLARTRALSAASWSALVEPRAGVPLLAALIAVSIYMRSPAPGTVFVRRFAWSIFVAGSTTTTIYIAIVLSDGTWPIPWPLVPELRLPEFDQWLAPYFPSPTLYAAFTLLGLLVVPLRWRSGVILVSLTAGALFLGDAQGPLVPTPAVLIIAGTAIAGWIWLAGSAAPRGKTRLGKWFAFGATVITVVLAAVPTAQKRLVKMSVATLRPRASIARMLDKGLIAPGDVALLYGDVPDHLESARLIEGWRPDVISIRANGLSGQDLLSLSQATRADNRRLLSNSFNAAGAWPPQLVLDSGPLFWLTETGGTEMLYTDLSAWLPNIDTLHPAEREFWIELVVERVRFRRALGDPAAALSALPVSAPDFEDFSTHLWPTDGTLPRTGGESELLPVATPLPGKVELVWWTEAGDLLWEYGDVGRATKLLRGGGRGRRSCLLGRTCPVAVSSGIQRSSPRNPRRSSRDGNRSTRRIGPRLMACCSGSTPRSRQLVDLDRGSGQHHSRLGDRSASAYPGCSSTTPGPRTLSSEFRRRGSYITIHNY